MAENKVRRLYVRNVIRIQNTYYLSIPKGILNSLGIIRGSAVLIAWDGRRFYCECAKEGIKSVFQGDK